MSWRADLWLSWSNDESHRTSLMVGVMDFYGLELLLAKQSWNQHWS